MSPNTRGFASIADAKKLSEHWHQTQIGQLVNDKSMRPFVEDLKSQLERKITGVRDKLGLEIADLKDVAAGEIGIALIEQEGSRAAVALTMDVTNNHPQLKELLSKVDQELTKRGAKKDSIDAHGTEMAVYSFSMRGSDKLRKEVIRKAIYFVKDDVLCATDSLAEAHEMLSRFAGKSSGLSSVLPYIETSKRCNNESNGLAPEVHWYFDPFGYATAVRSLRDPNEKTHGRDYLAILSSQGFDAIKGIGGFVNLAVDGSFELIHRTAIYAPGGNAQSNNYRLAMRMMKFPNGVSTEAPKWLPRKLASYRTFNMDINNAFDTFGTLFDAIAGYDDAFANVLKGLEKDPYGPQVDVKKDFVAHLGQRISLVTDYEVPITTKCERFLIAVELTNEQAVVETIKKFMDCDDNASQTQFAGKVVWEINEGQSDIQDIDIDLPDLDMLDGPLEDDSTTEANSVVEQPTSAVCVTGGHLFIASHTEFMKEILTAKAAQDTLGTAGDYHEVEMAMNRLSPNEAAARCFVRTDEAFRPVYEMLRQGKMPEAETMLGRFLNRLLSPPDDDEEGLLREQKIDGRKLPEFEMVRRYFGPAGTIVRSDNDGWFITGATLTKLSAQARATSRKVNGQVQRR